MSSKKKSSKRKLSKKLEDYMLPDDVEFSLPEDCPISRLMVEKSLWPVLPRNASRHKKRKTSMSSKLSKASESVKLSKVSESLKAAESSKTLTSSTAPEFLKTVESSKLLQSSKILQSSKALESSMLLQTKLESSVPLKAPESSQTSKSLKLPGLSKASKSKPSKLSKISKSSVKSKPAKVSTGSTVSRTYKMPQALKATQLSKASKLKLSEIFTATKVSNILEKESEESEIDCSELKMYRNEIYAADKETVLKKRKRRDWRSRGVAKRGRRRGRGARWTDARRKRQTRKKPKVRKGYRRVQYKQNPDPPYFLSNRVMMYSSLEAKPIRDSDEEEEEEEGKPVDIIPMIERIAQSVLRERKEMSEDSCQLLADECIDRLKQITKHADRFAKHCNRDTMTGEDFHRSISIYGLDHIYSENNNSCNLFSYRMKADDT